MTKHFASSDSLETAWRQPGDSLETLTAKCGAQGFKQQLKILLLGYFWKGYVW